MGLHVEKQRPNPGMLHFEVVFEPKRLLRCTRPIFLIGVVQQHQTSDPGPVEDALIKHTVLQLS